MIPSLVAQEITEGLRQYLITGFEPSNPTGDSLKHPESRFPEQFPLFDPFRPIELKQMDGGAPCRRGGNQRTVLRQGKMLDPAVLSRIEQGGDLPCREVNRSQVAAFMLVAQDAGQRSYGGDHEAAAGNRATN